ncbi:MAG: YgiQ family radical SAM protein, partial [Syntrophomonadaceae bacterium]|nr:YgiQ family radical SAM protein [Syntrophomonadaceae bacterium]
LEIPSYENVSQNAQDFSESTRLIQLNTNPYSAPPLAQKHENRWIIMNPPALPLTTEQMDSIYAIPFLRKYHPMYEKDGGVPALEPVQFSVLTHRGCFGGCAFCSIGLHQGKFIQNRSIGSIEAEVKSFTSHPDFRGSIPDLGAASANMYGLRGKESEKCNTCRRTSCLYPSVCNNLDTDHSPSIRMWQKIRKIKGVRHIRVASGVRYDLILQDKSGQYLRQLCEYHVGGQLKVAPEHVATEVTKLMGKPGCSEYVKFVTAFNKINKKLGKEQYLIPYFISAHPGSSLKSSVELAEFVRDQMQYYPEQVQNFTPTPMTISTSMYHTGLNPLNGKEVYVPINTWERKAQRALLQYRNRSNHSLVCEALEKCGRTDLIGSSRKALVKESTFATKRKPSQNKKSHKTEQKPKRGKSK